ncbi:MAG: glycosyltransferase family 4 protein [Acidobacteriota bacterium]
MRIGIYNRYWSVAGGGEKYVGAIAQFASKYGTVDLIAHQPFSIPMLEERLNLQLAHCKPVILESDSDDAAEDISSGYDLWVNGTFMSSVRSRASRSILVVMFPFFRGKVSKYLWRTALIKAPTPLQRLFWRRHGFWRTYDVIAAISSYTQHWIKRWWEADSIILRPPVDCASCSPAQEKKRMILSVGRFFKGGHNKKHDTMIAVFRQMHDSGACPGWEYHLCGGSHPEPAHQAYLENLTEIAEGYPIFIHPDINRPELESLYCQASVFWHAAGYNENERRWPERFEHFGITTVEAMCAGCVPVVIAKAGQNEIINPGVNGYSWKTLEELRSYTYKVMNDPVLVKRLSQEAIKSSALFSSQVFSDGLANILTRKL